MISEILNNDVVKRKTLLLQNAEKTLKEEFIGIDEIIDGVITNIRPWYLYPEIQEKPLVISLVGLTACGKTSLLNRLTELLEIKEDMVYFNFAEIGEMKSWEIEDSFENEISNGTSNKIFVYDEFQYAATLNGIGEEKDNKTGLKPFWELMDSGYLTRRISLYEMNRVSKLLEYCHRINERCPMKLEDGVWVNAEECTSHFTKSENLRFKEAFNLKKVKNNDDEICDNEILYGPDTGLFIPSSFRVFEDIKHMYDKAYGYIYDIDLENKIKKMDISEFMDFLTDILKICSKGYTMDFRKSVIFVIMNLDEAYEMSFNVNPDMLPDQFRKITKKLTIVDIKEALKKRFRNEQIGRMGNLFMIYPSFSEENFKDIIKLLLKNYSNSIKEKWAIDMVFEDSVVDMIYKDSVFPTHGVRPIISSVHEIIKTKFPLIIDELSRKSVNNVDRMVFSYTDENIVVSSYAGNEFIGETKIHQELRIDNHRQIENEEQQALTAVHESGHFVIFSKLYGKVPAKLCSSTIQKDTGGFMLKDYDDVDKIYSRSDYLNDIKISLAGYVAEKLVFRNHLLTSGAENDLKHATAIASSMVRKYGMGTFTEVTTYMLSEDCTSRGLYIKDDSQEAINAQIRQIINSCEKAVKNIFEDPDWRKMLKTSAIYLSENTNMPKEKMEEIYMSIPENKRNPIKDHAYRDALEKFI